MQRVGTESHLSRLSSGLNQLRQQASFCDVSIIVGDQRFPAHKAVLSSTSDYFQGMFSSQFQESTMSEVTVPGTEESFAQILDFVYTGYFTLSVRTVTNILKMACYMVFTEVMELCAEYLREVKDNFTTEDYFEIWSIANNHSSLLDVAQLYRSHLLKNFPRCIKSQLFLEKSSASTMMEFLSDEEIESDIMTEEHILQAALIWLKYDWEQRKVHAVDLLKKIRLGLVPLDRLRDILGDELLAKPECKNMVEEVVRLSVTKETASPPLIKSYPELFANRNTITAGLSASYDSNDSASAPVISLECKSKTACYKMTKLADIPTRYPYCGDKVSDVTPFVSSKNQLYAAIGVVYFTGQGEEDRENHNKWLSENNFFQYMSEKNEWIVLPPSPKVLEYAQIFQVKDYMYLIGVIGDYYSVIQRYSILSKCWEILMDDIPTVFECLAATLLSSGQILIKGSQRRAGPNLDGRHYGYQVDVVTLYRPATNELLDVSLNTTFDDDYFTFFVEHDDKCYLVTRDPSSIDKPLKPDQINRVICDFDSDKPTMTIADVIEDKTIDTDKHFYAEFTFDKRKLGLVQEPCECDSHTKSKEKLE